MTWSSSVYGGTKVKALGDRFMASFGSVPKAVECAAALPHPSRASGLADQPAGKERTAYHRPQPGEVARRLGFRELPRQSDADHRPLGAQPEQPFVAQLREAGPGESPVGEAGAACDLPVERQPL